MTGELLQDVVKLHRCPGIVFAEGVSGRRAAIDGTGIEVWEMVANWKSADCDFERLKKSYHWLAEAQLWSALGYFRAYPDEIENLIAQNESWTKESLSEKYPFLGGSGI